MTNSPSRLQVVVALAAVYLIWGSTYLAIRIAIETLPPFLMAGVRFVLAGAILYLWVRSRGAEPPTALHWRSTAIVGGLLLLGGNGGVVWAEQRVPSGLTALLVSMTPLWMTLMDWARPGGLRPTQGIVAGLLLGFGGVILLVGPGNLAGSNQVDLLGASALLMATLSWASGSLVSRHAPMPESPLLATAMEMLTGGALLVLLGTLTQEWGRIEWAQISTRSSMAFLYLIIFGSFIGFSAYVWLLKHTSVAVASTYAYVNPVVAVILGWAVAGETITPRTLLAACIIVSGVVMITVYRPKSPEPTSLTNPALSPGELNETSPSKRKV